MLQGKPKDEEDEAQRRRDEAERRRREDEEVRALHAGAGAPRLRGVPAFRAQALPVLTQHEVWHA